MTSTKTTTTQAPNPIALVIEDDETLGQVAFEALRMANYHTELIRDGRAALTRLSETKPALVVLDLHLPYISGRDVLRKIRENGHFSDTRVIIATADPSTADSLHHEADLVLIKPYSFVQLRDFASRLRPMPD